MPETIDWPPTSRRPRYLFVVAAALVVLFLASQRGLAYYVDGLWFGSLGYRGIFLKMLGVKWAVFAIFAVATFVIVYGAFLILNRSHSGAPPRNRAIVVNGQRITLNFEQLLRPVVFIGSVLIAIFTGLGMTDDWPVFARFWFAPNGSTGTADPIFGRSLNFYLLRLSALELVADWLITLAIVILAMAVVLFLLTGYQDSPSELHIYPHPSRWRGPLGALAFGLLVVASRLYLSRFDLLLADHTVFSGVTYVDAHVMLPGLLLVCIALVVGAGAALFGATSRPNGRWVLVSVLPAVGCFLGLQVLGSIVSAFIVKPNELVKEEPFISHNIEFTRQAYRLDKITLRPFSAQTNVAAADATGNQGTLQNIRLWDWRALQDTLRQVQEIRTYYDFPDIDIDRYQIDGATREVMLAARELNIEKLPESSQNWINEKLIYTHGYGTTMNPVNGFTPEGLPTLILSNMPVQTTVPSLALTRPEIYFGELTDHDVYVNTRQKEFNYPQGQTNSLTSYEGSGGIVLGGLLHRSVIALERGDIAKLPFSDDVTDQSRLLMRRNIRARVKALAPFLTFDSDPYIVVDDNGRLSWIMDAYTTSDTYPYSRHAELGDTEFNYVRNSVKAVVDAYNGTTTFYVFDQEDPVLAAYRNAFPTLFRDASTMPSSLYMHIRYPDLLLKLQAEAYGLYHMTNPEMFYNREDLWTPATELGLDENGDRTTQEMAPNFVLMKLPGEGSIEFVNILPFTPANRNNLIGWIAGRSDGANYGSAVVYNFPKSKLVDGPLQVEARIDQNAQISGQLTLWNQQGSHVRRGNLLVIPTGSALLYAEAIYLQADRSPMPELRLVVLALQDRLAYGPTFEAAMTGLFGGTPSSLSAPAAPSEAAQPAPASGSGSKPGADRDALIHEAAQDLSDYQRLTAQGELGRAGEKLEQLKKALEGLTGR